MSTTIERLTDHFSIEEFDRLHDCACDGEPINSEHDMQFLRDIWNKYLQHGDQMFFSKRQCKYLRMLAVRGGWRKPLPEGMEAA
jgi:hypothetical protein